MALQVAVKIVKRAGLPEDDEKALKEEVRAMCWVVVVGCHVRWQTCFRRGKLFDGVRVVERMGGGWRRICSDSSVRPSTSRPDVIVMMVEPTLRVSSAGSVC